MKILLLATATLVVSLTAASQLPLSRALPQAAGASSAEPLDAAPATGGRWSPLGDPIELSGLLDAGFVSVAPEGFLMTGGGYRADVVADRLRFVPAHFERVPGLSRAEPFLELSLRALITAGGELQLVPSGPPVQPGGLFGGAVVTPYVEQGIVQLLTARPDGVELELWIERRPALPGALSLRYAYEAELERISVETTPGNFEHLDLGGAGHVTIGHAVAIDATGRRTQLELTLAPGELGIEVPANLLQDAVFPLRIDPLIGTQIPISGAPGSKDSAPDVAFDPTGGEHLVVWQRPTSASNSDVWGARVGASGTVTAGPFAIDTTASVLKNRPTVAVDPNTGNYLVAYEYQPSAGARTIRWRLFDSGDLLLATQSFTVSGYLGEALPDAGFVDGLAGASGFLLAQRRDQTTVPDSVVQVTWIDATTAAVIDSQAVTPLSPARDGSPAVPQLADANPSLVAFQRFNTTTVDLEVFASCVTLGGGLVTLGTPVNVSSNLSRADGNPDVACSGSGPFQVAWEQTVVATGDRDISAREVLSDCSAAVGATTAITSVGPIQYNPAVIQGRYSGACDDQAVVLYGETNAPFGSAPTSLRSRRWISGAGTLGTLETVAVGQAGVVTWSSPRAALDSSSTVQPRFLLVYDDDDGTGSITPPGDVFGQLYTFDQIPVSVAVTPAAPARCVGGSVTFTAAVTGTGTFTFQWRYNGVPIAGATAVNYTRSALGLADAGAYDVVATGTCGALASNAAVLSVEQPLTSAAISGPSFGCQGVPVTLNSVLTGGSGAFTYQWLRNGTPIPGATLASYAIASLQAGDVGTYTVGVINSCGAVISSSHVLSFSELPAGASLSADNAPACVGESVTLTASVTAGSPPLSYEFFKNGISQGAPSASNVLTFSSAQASDSGDYSVVVSNPCALSTSALLTLRVDEPVTGVTIAASTGTACVGDAVTLTASIVSGSPQSYGWFKNGSFLTVTAVNQLSLSSVQVSDAGDYSVTIGNACGNVSSGTPATLSVAQTPTSVAVSGPTSGCTGTGATLTSSVSGGTTPFTYQWSRNGSPIPGATGADHSIPSLALADAGTYTVQASNPCGTVTSAGHALAVTETLSGVTIAASTGSACVGASVTFTASVAAGTATSYGWFRDGGFLTVTAVNVLTIPSAQLTDTGSYTVTAGNVCGNVPSSGAAALQVAVAATGVSTSGPTSGCTGTMATFTSTVSGGTGPFAYQWYLDASPIPGATGSSLSIASLSLADAGTYRVQATNACGSVTSVGQTLSVTEALSGVTIAASTGSACVGTSVTFTASVAAGTATTYGWFKDGGFLTATAVNVLTIPSAQLSDAGSYTVTAGNLCGNVPSSGAAALQVAEAPSSVSASGPTTGCVGSSVAFSSTVTGGTGPFTYQWFLNGAPIPGATGSTYSIASVQAGDSGTYAVQATNACSSVLSSGQAFQAAEAPASVSASGPGSGCTGTLVTFTSSVVGGTAPIGYQWLKDAAPIGGATGPSYSIASLVSGDAGSYSVQASNACGTVSSAGQALLVTDALSGVTIVASSGSACVGASVTFTASSAIGTATSYAWFKDAAFLTTTAVNTLTLSSVLPSDAGSYTVTASNACGSAPSAGGAALQVDEAPAGVSASASAPGVCVGAPVTFTAAVTSGTAPFQYEWFKDGGSLGAPSGSNTLSIASAQPSDAGAYVARVSNACGFQDSAAASLTVDTPPAGVSVAASATSVCGGASLTLTASVTSGTAPFLYEWFKDGVSLGAASASNVFTIPSAQPSDSGDYSVVASNGCAGAASSATTISVAPPPSVYCTSKTTSIPGCVPVISYAGTPSASAGLGFNVNVGPTPGQNTGMYIYTTNGPLPTPTLYAFGWLCVTPGPGLYRVGLQNGGGNTGLCNGSYTVDFNQYFATQGQDPNLVAGAQVDIQLWYRDGPGGAVSNTSGAGQFVMCP